MSKIPKSDLINGIVSDVEHVRRIIDALDGSATRDIYMTGSLNISGSVQVSGNVVLHDDLKLEGVISGGLELETGTRINEISIDGLLSSDSDTAISTEKAIKTYIDKQVSIVTSGSVAGTGIAGYIPIWNSTVIQSTSSIFEDSLNVGIGTIDPKQKLHVVGNVSASEFHGDGVNVDTLTVSKTGSFKYANISKDVIVSGNVTASEFHGDGVNIIGIISSSYSVTSSYAVSASHTEFADNAYSASYSVTSSYAVSASHTEFADNAYSASFATTASFLIGFIESASYANSASYAVSASHAEFADDAYSASYSVTSSYAVTSSYSTSASFAQNVPPGVAGFWTGSGDYIERLGDVKITGSLDVDGTASIEGEFHYKNRFGKEIKFGVEPYTGYAKFDTVLWVSSSSWIKASEIRGDSVDPTYDLRITDTVFLLNDMSISESITLLDNSAKLYGTASWADNTPLSSSLVPRVEQNESDISTISSSTFVNAVKGYGLVTDEPTGFQSSSRADTHISFSNDNRTFFIYPKDSSFNYYIKGVEYIETTTQSVVLLDTQGEHVIYFNEAGVLSSVVSAIYYDSILELGGAIVSEIYWNSGSQTNLFVSDELHGLVMDSYTHAYLHQMFGAQWLSGIALNILSVDGNGNNNIDGQIGIEDGVILDEDLQHNIITGQPMTLTPTGSIPVFYKTGSSGYWSVKELDEFPVIYSGSSVEYNNSSGRLPYNQNDSGDWKLTEIANGSYVLIHIFATNDIYNRKILAVQGQNEYTTITSAREGANNEISSIATDGLSTDEYVAIGTVIYKSTSAPNMTNIIKASIQSTDDGSSYVDFRQSGISGGSGVGVADHGLLTGLSDDDHSQYVLVDGTRNFEGTSSFALTASYAETVAISAGSWTGSDGYISRLGDVQITGSLIVTETGSFQQIIVSQSANLWKEIDYAEGFSLKYLDYVYTQSVTELANTGDGNVVSQIDYYDVKSGNKLYQRDFTYNDEIVTTESITRQADSVSQTIVYTYTGSLVLTKEFK